MIHAHTWFDDKNEKSEKKMKKAKTLHVRWHFIDDLPELCGRDNTDDGRMCDENKRISSDEQIRRARAHKNTKQIHA